LLAKIKQAVGIEAIIPLLVLLPPCLQARWQVFLPAAPPQCALSRGRDKACLGSMNTEPNNLLPQRTRRGEMCEMSLWIKCNQALKLSSHHPTPRPPSRLLPRPRLLAAPGACLKRKTRPPCSLGVSTRRCRRRTHKQDFFARTRAAPALLFACASRSKPCSVDHRGTNFKC